MNNWLVKMAAKERLDVDRLMDTMSDLPLEDIKELMLDAGMRPEPLPHTEAFLEKLAFAEEAGKELAKTAGKLWGGADRDLAADHLKSDASLAEYNKKFYGTPKKEKTAGLGGTLMSMGQKALGAAKPMAGKALNLARENPMAAMAGAGGALGAASGLVAPGRDAQGNTKSRLGAMVTRGAVGAGAGALASRIPTGGGTNLGEHVSNMASAKMGRIPYKNPAPFRASAFAPQDPTSLSALAAPYFQAQGGPMAKMAGLTGSGFIKLAMNIARGPDGSPDWLEQFKGTPLLQQAIQLEQQALALEMKEIEVQQQEQAEREQNQAKWQTREALWSQRDQLSLQKRQLALQLASQEVGMAGGGAPAEALPEMPPAELQAAPQPTEGMPKMARMMPPVMPHLRATPPPIPAAAQSLASKMRAVATSDLARLGPIGGSSNVNGALTSRLARRSPHLYAAAANLG